MPGSRRPWTPVRAFLAIVASGPALVASPKTAHADAPADEPIVVAYTAIDGACPAKDAFVASVRRYTTKWTPVDVGTGLRSLQLRLGPRGADYAGSLVVTTANGSASVRELVGPDCASVARALAVMVALAIDPLASVAEPRPAREPEVPPPSPGAEAEAGGDAAAPPAPQPVSPPPPAARRESPPSRSSPSQPPNSPPEDRAAHVTFAVEGRIELTSAVTTGALPVVGTALEMQGHLGSAWPTWLTPSIALGARQSLPKQISIGPGASEFLWTVATVRLCPVRFAALAGRLDVAPCAEMDVGTLRAEARGLPNARASSSAWFDRGGSLRVSHRISSAWGIGAGVLVTAPSSRDRFALGSGQLISRAPAVGVTGGLLLELKL